MPDLQALVDEALNNAIANGYNEILSWSVTGIAASLKESTTGFEDHTVRELAPHIRNWLHTHSPQG